MTFYIQLYILTLREYIIEKRDNFSDKSQKVEYKV